MRVTHLAERRLDLAHGRERQCDAWGITCRLRASTIPIARSASSRLRSMPSQLTLGQGLDRQSEHPHDGRRGLARDRPWTTGPSPG